METAIETPTETTEAPVTAASGKRILAYWIAAGMAAAAPDEGTQPIEPAAPTATLRAKSKKQVREWLASNGYTLIRVPMPTEADPKHKEEVYQNAAGQRFSKPRAVQVEFENLFDLLCIAMSGSIVE